MKSQEQVERDFIDYLLDQGIGYVAVNDDDVLTYVGSHVWSVDHGKSI